MLLGGCSYAESSRFARENPQCKHCSSNAPVFKVSDVLLQHAEEPVRAGAGGVRRAADGARSAGAAGAAATAGTAAAADRRRRRGHGRAVGEADARLAVSFGLDGSSPQQDCALLLLGCLAGGLLVSARKLDVGNQELC